VADTMVALVDHGPEAGSVELRRIPRPTLAPHSVELRVDAVGVCGSDVHQGRGSHGWRVDYPCLLGHEFTGTVVEVGASVRGFEPGARVVSALESLVAAVTEPCRVAYGAVCEAQSVKPGDHVLVLGPGPIGSLGDGLGVDVTIDAAGVSAALESGATADQAGRDDHRGGLAARSGRFQPGSARAGGTHADGWLLAQLADLGAGHPDVR